MARIITVGKGFSYESSNLKTPIFKEISPASCSYDSTNNDESSQQSILMDEFGQTPDHYYLARKPPSSFFQVKRKLDLHSVGSSKRESGRPTRTSQMKKIIIPKKPKIQVAVEKPRFDTSLGQLTKKFLKLLSDASDGIVNLNTACSLLAVPKRRLYDITNVLEGAGLIRKTSRNNIQWMGRVVSPCANVKYELEKEIDILEAKENKLDELIYYMKSQMNTILDEETKYRYVTSEDLKKIKEFSEQTVIGVNTTPSTEIVESDDKTLVIKSKCIEIEAYLLSNDVSFANILHPKALFKENSYQVKIENNSLDDDKSDSFPEKLYFGKHGTSTRNPMEVYNPMCSGSIWSHGDTIIKNAFITEEDDLAPMGKNFLMQTEDQDQDLDLPMFSLLEIPMDNYSFSLDNGEGITDLFDCAFPCP